CGRSYPELSPQSFSFNNPQGMCPDCSGLGTRAGMDPDLVVPNKTLTIDEGAVAPWGNDVSKKDTGWGNGVRFQLLKKMKIPLSTPWNKLSRTHKDAVLYGTGEKRYQVEWKGDSGGGTFQTRWEGVLP